MAADRFWFRSGHLALDFALTGGPGVLARWEVLHEPADLGEWLQASPLQVDVGRCTRTDLERARALRDAIRRLALDVHAGRRLHAPSRDVVNAAAARSPLSAALVTAGARRWVRPTTTQALATIAREAIELIGGPRSDRVRECAADNCYLLFLDTSPPGWRRWCSEQRCANRAHVRAHRQRQQRGVRSA